MARLLAAKGFHKRVLECAIRVPALLLAGLLSFAVTPAGAGVFDTLDKVEKSVTNAEKRVDQSTRIKDSSKRIKGKSGDLADEVTPESGSDDAPAPPPPAAKPFYFESVGGGKQAVPAEQVAARIASGDVQPGTLAWTEGMAEWKPASDLPSLRKLFAAQPPPLPPKR